VIANDVSDNPNTIKKIGGVGPVVSDLEWDVKLYLTLNGAMHELPVPLGPFVMGRTLATRR
jgi:hypothetical protein